MVFIVLQSFFSYNCKQKNFVSLKYVEEMHIIWVVFFNLGFFLLKDTKQVT